MEESPRYEGSPKHKHPWQHGRRGSLCPQEITPEVAQALLEESQVDGTTRYATHEGLAFCAREHQPGRWHGYPVRWHEVPPPLRRVWQETGLVTKSQIRSNW